MGIAGRLAFRDGDFLAELRTFRLHYANRYARNEQGIVYLAGAGGKFPHGYAKRSRQIQFL